MLVIEGTPHAKFSRPVYNAIALVVSNAAASSIPLQQKWIKNRNIS